jgi:hypothetical protein
MASEDKENEHKKKKQKKNEHKENEQGVAPTDKYDYTEATGLRGLGFYFYKFDEFVKQDAPALTDPLELLRAYEASSHSPYGKLCRFLPFSEEIRVTVTKNRYKSFFSK